MSKKLQDVMWGSAPNKLAVARENARELKNRGKVLEAHTVMLSAYITVLGSGKGGLLEKAAFAVTLSYLYLHAGKLNHAQLDVLIQGILKTKRIRGFPVGKPALEELAHDAMMKASQAGVPWHEVALAYMTHAEVVMLAPANHELAKHSVRWALFEETNILREGDLHGLRQLVRIYRKAGEVYRETGDESIGKEYLLKALALAEGEAQTSDQARKIRELLK